MKSTDASPSMDRRVARSKASMRDALVSLIIERGFDAVTVNDIAARADINRATFYLHYRDKFDLLEQTEDEVTAKIERIIAAGEVLKPDDLINVDKPLPVIVALFEYLKDNAPLMHAILGLRGDVALQTKIRKSLERNLKFGALSGGRPLTFLAPAEYLISYGLSASFGVVQLWLERGCAETPREMAVILTRLSLGGAVRAIVVG